MNVAGVLKSKGAQSARIVTVRPETTIASLAHMMKLEGIGALVVSEDKKTLAGLISERDVVMGLVDNGTGVLEMRVSELMQRSVASCAPGDDVKDVMKQMTRRRMRHLPVIEDGALRGVISIGDVVKSRLEEAELEMNVLREAYIASH